MMATSVLGLLSGKFVYLRALPARISITVGGLLLVSLITGSAAFVASVQTSRLINGMLIENMSSVRGANELAMDMLEQRGLASAYLLDNGNSFWIEQLEIRMGVFRKSLERVRNHAATAEEQVVLQRIVTAYEQYNRSREEAIRLYDAGDRNQAGQILVNSTPLYYEEARHACEDLIRLNTEAMREATSKANAAGVRLWWLTATCFTASIVLATVLLVFLGRGVFQPLKEIAEKAKRLTSDRTDQGSFGRNRDLAVVQQTLASLADDAAGAHESLERQKEQLRISEELASVGKLTTGVAHEVRSLLTTMKLWSYSLHNTRVLDSQVQNTFETMHQELSRLEQLVSEFLLVARPPQLNQQCCSLAAIGRASIQLIEPRLAEKDLQICQNIDDQLPGVLGDPDQLKQVFVNLLVNASEGADHGSQINVTAGWQPLENGRGRIVVKFANSGPPIPLDARAEIFEPFRTSKKKGVGLGLALAAAIAQRHGGELTLEASDENGTVFALVLPQIMEADSGQSTPGG